MQWNLAIIGGAVLMSGVWAAGTGKPATMAGTQAKPAPPKERTMAKENGNSDLPLIVLLGDSIRMGYQNVAIRELAGTAKVWSPKENCAHTAHTLANLGKWLQDKNPAVIHINCGLHDMWRNEDGSVRHSQDVYLKNLGAIFAKLKELAPGATLVFALTTPVDQDRQKTSNYGRIVRYNADIPLYNTAARKLAEAQGLLVDDLYSAVEEVGTQELIGPDGVHFNPEGCKVLGKAVAAFVRTHGLSK